MTLNLFPTSGAVFSQCRKYRYRLWREWRGFGSKPTRWMAVCGLNCSTADEREDDPTIRRCIDFAKQWGFTGLLMTNLFAYISTAPSGLLGVAEPIGAENDAHLMEVAGIAERFVFAWGRHEVLKSILPVRAGHVYDLVRAHSKGEIGTLGVNGDGSPRHPLYLPKTTQFVREAR